MPKRSQNLLIFYVLVAVAVLVFYSQIRHKASSARTQIETQAPAPPNADLFKFSTPSIVTIAGYEAREAAVKWINNLVKLGYTNLAVLCVDRRLAVHLRTAGLNSNSIRVPDEWLGRPLNESRHSKALIWHKLLSIGQNFIYSDLNAAFLSSTLVKHVELVFKHSQAEVIFGQELWSERAVAHSVNFFMAAATSFARDLFLQVYHEQQLSQVSEQEALGRVLSRTWSRNDTRVEAFDAVLYASTKVDSELKLTKLMEIEPMVIYPAAQRSERDRPIESK
jgi:hypothetical protein